MMSRFFEEFGRIEKIAGDFLVPEPEVDSMRFMPGLERLNFQVEIIRRP